MFRNSTILITGGTGSWGQELVRKLLTYQPKEIRIFSRNEYTQVLMNRAFAENTILRFIIGDIRDSVSLEEACIGVDYLFHLAALKHVPICENQPEEAIKTNITGTENVIRASIKSNIKKVIDVSTDKAADPINLYGMTKAIGEKLMIQANNKSDKTQFVCIRSGNVLGTNGSVVPFFKNLILSGQDVTLTTSDMTRFFLTLSEAINLLLQAAEVAVGGEIFVIKMKACRIVDLAKVMINNLAQTQVAMREIGIRQGEKRHEVLITKSESPYTYQYKKDHFVILPSHPHEHLVNQYGHLPKISFDLYHSNMNLMSPEEIEQILLGGGFLQ